MAIALAKVVVLTISVLDSSSGTLLYKDVEQMQMSGFSMSGSRIEDCRLMGVARAKKLTAQYRTTYPYAFTNVDCRWVKSTGQEM